MQALFKGAQQDVFSWRRHQGRELLLINHPLCQAVFSVQGAQLLHFQPRGERPLLWCAARWPQVGAIRGGVPVCWPWFGRHPTETGWPHHGWARLDDWQLLSKSSSAQGVQLCWRLQLHDWQVELEAQLGDAMHLQLRTRHSDSEPCVLSHALHAYWRVSDINALSISGLEGIPGYHLRSREDCQQATPVRIADACHQLYSVGAALRLNDPHSPRQLLVDTCGNANTVLWHPGSQPLNFVSWSESLAFVSIQAAACEANSLTLAPGQDAVLNLHARLL
ncbi:D-hexose-6-phosphate mutarotase [Pseudomonas sp. 5P_3.1_Bac2]|nr:D-hexose-6-phosphate mutarotase [Pseudomonas sp. 5P_3.1_Bac2]MCU1718565.1 D-hexose-6-phosphate mutarotase [Pseudomonas sp. 5P_3.1_Bac2]